MSIIKLVPNPTDSIGLQINEISKVIEKGQELNTDFSVCFGDINFIHPTITLGVASLIGQFAVKGQVCQPTNINSTLGGYLDTISFPYGIFPDRDPDWKSKLDSYRNKNFLPIINFPTDGSQNSTNFRNSVLSKINELIAIKLDISFSKIGPISYFLSELTDNIVEHSCVPRGKIILQYFPSKEYLEICLLDEGRTILGSYQKSERGRGINTDKEAINQAINGVSTKSVERGFGIPTSLNLIVKGLGGHICLISGSGMLVDQTITSFSSRWNGTLVSIKIPKAKINSLNMADFI